MMFSDLVKGIVNDIPERDWKELQKLTRKIYETILTDMAKVAGE